tara:strand:+ start:327 stop:569 length:243 start_codon:yes stop_codon:yes gene_type:complete
MPKFNNENLPKFLIADNSENPNDIFIVHTHFPSFVLNVINDDFFWLEEFSKDDENEIKLSSEILIKSALNFYDSEIKSIK